MDTDIRFIMPSQQRDQCWIASGKKGYAEHLANHQKEKG